MTSTTATSTRPGGADARTALKGLRQGALFSDQLGAERSHDQAGDPYQYQGGTNPFSQLLAQWRVESATDSARRSGQQDRVVRKVPPTRRSRVFGSGTTSIQNWRHIRVGRIRDPERAADPGSGSRANGSWAQPAGAKLRARRADGPFNVMATGKTSARDLDTGLAPQGRRAIPLIRRAGRRRTGSESSAVLLNVVEFG